LAARFEGACGPLTGRFVETIESGNVALDELEQFAPLTPSGITTDSEERLLYEHVLFADTGLQRSTDIDRRRTMLLILELAWQLGRGPNVDEVRWVRIPTKSAGHSD
jgi:hypothetical protein